MAVSKVVQAVVAGRVVGESCTSGLQKGDGTVEHCSSLVSLVTTFIYCSSVNRSHTGTRNGYGLRLGSCPRVTSLTRHPVFQIQQCGSHCSLFASLAVEWGHPWLFPDLVASLEPGTGLLNLSMLRMRT